MALRFFVLGTLGVLTTLTAWSAVAPLRLNGPAYENATPTFSVLEHGGAMAGERLLNFDPTDATDHTSLDLSVPPLAPGRSLVVMAEWDQSGVAAAAAGTGASGGIDLCVTGATGATTITDYEGNSVSCSGPSAVGADSVQILVIGNPANATGNTPQQTLKVMIGLASDALGTSVPAHLRVSVSDDGLGTSAVTAGAAIPPAPTLVLGASSLVADTTTTITWNAVDASYCIAGGNANALQTGWHGTLATSGSYTVTPINPGTYSYLMFCVNAAGNSPRTTVNLTVTPSPFSGGVGALDAWSLLALSGSVVLLRQRMLRSSDGAALPRA